MEETTKKRFIKYQELVEQWRNPDWQVHCKATQVGNWGFMGGGLNSTTIGLILELLVQQN